MANLTFVIGAWATRHTVRLGGRSRDRNTTRGKIGENVDPGGRIPTLAGENSAFFGRSRVSRLRLGQTMQETGLALRYSDGQQHFCYLEKWALLPNFRVG